MVFGQSSAQGLDGGRLKQRGDGQPATQALLYFEHQAGGEERVAPQCKEVILAHDSFPVKENLPDADQFELQQVHGLAGSILHLTAFG